MLMRSAHVARGLTRRSARGLALATQSNLDHDAVRAAENAIRAPMELRFGSPPPPRAGDDATAQMARRFDRARALSEAEREEVLAEADEIVQRRATRRREMDQLVNAVETASGPVYTEERYAAVQLEGTTRDERVQSLWRVLRANARRRPSRPRGWTSRSRRFRR